MFCDLSREALQDFNRLGVQTTVPRGAILFHEGDPSLTVAVICAGQVKLSCTSREGKTLITKIAMQGDVLGLGAVISGSPYEVTGEALGSTTVKNIRKAEFLDFLEHHGQASMHAARTLSEEYKAAFFDARRLALAQSAAGRIASVLLEWARRAGCSDTPMRFTMALTHEELANVAGTSRETVTRVFSRLRKEKTIAVRGSSITLLDPDRLATLE